MGTLNVLDVTKKYSFIKALVCVTSDKCYANNFSTRGFQETDKLGGDDPYSASKAAAENLFYAYNKSFFKKNNIGAATVRAGNVIGGGDWSKNRLIPDCIRSLLINKEIFLRNPNYTRPWQHVLEPLKGYLILAKKQFESPSKFSGAWNFGTKQNTVTNVEEIVKKIINYWGAGKYKVKSNNTHYEQTNLQLNINKAQKILKWTPTLSINESIKLTVEWYKSVLILSLIHI